MEARTPGARLVRLAVAVLLAALVAGPAAAQYFGRNKVLYEDFDFRVLRTEHFDVYYYPELEPVVGEVGRMAERWYARLSSAFDYQLSERKPIILYANPSDFQQTTVSGGLIGQGTGGFTESIRNRVVMPLTDVWADTDHVLGHELVHVFQFDLAGALLREAPAGPGLQLPLWIIEGLAEYESQGRRDPQTAMWLRDALVHDYLPGTRQLDRDARLSPYQFGQAFWAYVAGRWGDESVARLYALLQRLSIDQAFREVLGESPERVFEAWREAIALAYRPVVLERYAPGAQARRVLTEDASRSTLNIAPSISPDGRLLAFLSTRDLVSIELFLADARTGEVLDKLLSADADPHFDALRFLDSAGAWSPDGERFAFVVLAEGDNALAIVDVGTRRVVRSIPIEDVGGVTNPAWSPDGRFLAFSGSIGGKSDLFVVEVATGELRQLTRDPYADLQPAWSPDGERIAFVTDRGPGTDLDELRYGPMRLAFVDPVSREIELLATLDADKSMNPQFTPEGGSLLFVSNPEGISDLFRLDLETGAVTRLTRLQTGVTGITELAPAMSVAGDTGDVYFSALENGSWNVYALDPARVEEGPIETGIPYAGLLPPVDSFEDTVVARYLARPRSGLPPRGEEWEVTDYRPRFGLEYVGPATIGIGSDRYGVGAGGSVSLFFGDLLRRHQLGVGLQGGQTTEGLGTTFGGQVVYLNQANRFQWGGLVARTPYLTGGTTVRSGTVEVDGTPVSATEFQQFIELVTIDQVAALAQYPLSLNRRIEGELGVSRYGFDRVVDRAVFSGNTLLFSERSDVGAPDSFNLYRGAVAFVGDTSYFGFASPIRGQRYRLEVGTTSGDLSFQTALADWRRYLFARPVTFAFRAMHFGRYGTDADSPRLAPLFLGDWALVRGYGVDSFRASECTVVPGISSCPEFDRLLGSRIGVVSAEVRFPLLGTEQFGIFEAPYVPTELGLFVDGGVAWTADEEPELTFDRDSTERVPVFSTGVTLRTVLGGVLPLELYYAFPLQRPDQGAEFGFFISPGW